MIALDDYHRLMERIQVLENRKAVNEGKLEEMMDRLKKEHKCSTLEEALKKLDKLTKQRQSLYQEYTSLLDQVRASIPNS